MAGTYVRIERRRKHLRLPAYDYSRPGAYFVTVCTTDRSCVFGSVTGGALAASPAGRLVDRWWTRIPDTFSSVRLRPYVVMPNHLHGLLLFGDSGGVGQPPSLPKVMQWFKSITTAAYRKRVSEMGWPFLEGGLWQRGYYDHIVRDDEDLSRIAEYILGNPAKWDDDQENPAHVRPITRWQ